MISTRKIFAVALGAAMVIVPVSGVLVSSAFAASSYNFTANLTVGSRGADVTALQSVLNSGGFLQVQPTGYFGSLTKAALAAWQASVGISPAAGYFGPITRAYLNNGTSAAPVASCPAGYSCTPSTPAPVVCPVGYTCTSTGTTGGTVTGWTPDGTDGSVTVGYTSYAPASQTLNKGQSGPIISVQLQAVDGPVAVTRFDVHFSQRPWLLFGSLNLTDSSGKVLATKTLSSAADATEITVGSDYLVRFDNINPIVVTPGTYTILAVTANVLAATDKIPTGGTTVYVSVPSDAIRTINGKGYTDSVGLSSGSQGGTDNSSYGNTVNLSSTGSTASIYTRIDPSSPATTQQIVTSSSQTTPSVTLGVFGVESQNQNSTINGLTFNLNTVGMTAAQAFSNVRIKVGSQIYGSNQVGAVTTFTNLNIPLTQNTWTPIALVADVQSGIGSTTSQSSTATLVASGIVGVDANYNNLVLTSASNETSASNTYSFSGVNITNESAAPANCTSYTSANKCDALFSFTVTNAGNTDIFISKTPAIALSTSTSPSTSSTTISSISIAAAPGDTVASYDVGANSSRTFTYNGTINAAATGETFKITGIKFGTVSTDGTGDATMNAQTTTSSSTNETSIITTGLEQLSIFKSL